MSVAAVVTPSDDVAVQQPQNEGAPPPYSASGALTYAPYVSDMYYMPQAMLRLSKKHLLSPGEQQPFDFLVVLDFEATCEADRTMQDPQEIIEFPAVLVDTKSESIVAEFHRFVKPTAKPQLSSFCRQLTGIAQETIDQADAFPVVIQAFLGWLAEHGLDVHGVAGPSFIFLTHGDWDLREMLPKQMDMCDLTGKEGYDAACLRRWVNLNPLFDAAFMVTPGTLPKMASGVESIATHLGMRLDGRLHSGIDDTRNIAKIVMRMLRFGVRMTPIQATCHRCGLPGHFARECPHAPPPVAYGSRTGVYSSAVQPRPGDWFCAICGNLVFARRTHCFQCGTPRP